MNGCMRRVTMAGGDFYKVDQCIDQYIDQRLVQYIHQYKDQYIHQYIHQYIEQYTDPSMLVQYMVLSSVRGTV